ncbi:MAG: sulfotransferase domain-containing protein [Opitutales bacterium]|nr:sulfotransferase domain-containing protein [Opitutales bacterium]
MKPLLFLNTLPKSGSIFLWDQFAKILSVEQQRITVASGTFPDDLVVPEKVDYAKSIGAVAQAHVRATHKNLTLLDYCSVDKTVIHLRDPRQAILSWTHHVDRLKKTEEFHLLKMIEPIIPNEYFEWSLSDKISFQIENMLPVFVSWIDDWMTFLKSDKCDHSKVVLVSYEQFKSDQTGYFRKILKHFGFTHDLQDALVPSPSEGQLHFRKGKVDEWRNVFEKNHRDSANKMVSPIRCKKLSELGIDLDS